MVMDTRESSASLRTWALVGRDSYLDDFTTRLDDPTSRAMVLAAPSGCGKSRLLARMAEEAAAAGREVISVRGAQSAAAVSFAPFLAAVPPAGGPDLGAAQMFSLMLDEIRRRDPVVLIDDAHQLDDASAALAAGLATAAEGAPMICVIAVRVGEVMPAAIEGLWKDDLADRVDLPMLSRAEVDELLAGALDGPVPATVARQFWSLTRGHPLYLHELAQSALERGGLRVVDGAWHLEGTLAPTAHLHDLVTQRLRDLDARELDALHLVALHSELGPSMLAEVAGAAAIQRLVARGLLEERRAGERRILEMGHPLYAEVLTGLRSATERRDAYLRLAELVEAAGARRRTDPLVVVMSRLAAGADVTPERVMSAGEEALALTDYRLAAELASHPSVVGTPVSLLLRARAAAGQRRPDDAEALFFEALGLLPAGDDAARIRIALAMHAMENRLAMDASRRHLDVAAAQCVGDEVRNEVRLAQAFLEHIHGFPYRTIEMTSAVEPGSVSRQAWVSREMLLLSGLSMAGRFEECAAVRRRLYDLIGSEHRWGWMDHERTEFMHHVALSHISPRTAIALARRTAAESELRSDDSAALSMVGLLFCSTVVGRIDLAIDAFVRWQRAVAGSSDRLTDNAGMACGGVLAILREDWAGAHWTIAESDALPLEANTWPLVELVRGRIMVADGAGEDGVDHLVGAARRALDAGLNHFVGLIGSQLHALGRHEDALEVMDAVLAASDATSLSERWRDGSRFAAARDSGGLEAAAMDHLESGFLVDAVRDAAWAAHYADTPLDRLRLRLWAERVMATTGGLSCPVVRSVERVLTPREEEIVLAAAGGWGNRQLAEHFVMSQRTVENHLHRGLGKLETDRATLVETLGPVSGRGAPIEELRPTG